jgi:DNA ligase-1
MKFGELAKYLEKLEKTSSRIKITEILSEVFKKAKAEEIDKITYLLLGQLAPSYEGLVFNIAERMMLQIIAKAFSVDIQEVKKIYKKKGDLGRVAFACAKNKKSKSKSQNLSVVDVYEELKLIAEEEGEGSQERKIEGMAKLLANLDSLSVRYVGRMPIGRLRLGFSDKTIIDALSWMVKGDKTARDDLEKAYFVLPDIGLLAKSVKKFGVIKALRNIKPVIGVPVLPMLAQRLKSPAEMVEKMQEVGVEPKFDGLRIQIHYKKSGFGKEGKNVRAFTRNLNDTGWMFPELKGIKKYIHADEAILDCEAVGVDEKRRVLANFQKTMTRRRKHEIEKIASKIPIRFYVFDILLKNEKSMMNKKYVERREVLDKTVKKSKVLEVVDSKITQDPKVIEKMMKMEIKEGLEGIIVKRAGSRYVPGRCGWRWVKMKEEESAKAKLADTLDCIVMGYSVGRGKRAEFGIGQFLVGMLDPLDDEKIKSLTKVGTGLTDDQFRELKKRLVKLEVSNKPKEYKVDKDLKPDFWVRPSLVVEVAADEITKSPKHTAGYALRFPRLVKFRDDKSVSQATTVSEIKKLFKLQKS